METPETGMWGAGDFPADFVTIDDAITAFEQAPAELDDCDYMWIEARIAARSKVVDALIELAHDLDARGLVLVSEVPTETMQDAGESYLHSEGWDASPYHAGKCFEVMAEVGALEFPPIPIKIDTADADLETGGE